MTVRFGVTPLATHGRTRVGTTSGAYDPAIAGSVLLPNDDPNHYYAMSAYEGLYNSINTVTFQTAAALDFCNIQKMATAAGVKDGLTNEPYDLSAIPKLIGTNNVAPIDMATSFATFASGGIRCNPIAITSVVDASGKDYPVQGADCQRTISEDVAAGVTYALQSVLVKGSGWNIGLNDKSNAFAKTGTTDGNIDTWTVGATNKIATASWFGSYQGNADQWKNQDITINGKYYAGVDGADLAGGQWAAVMNAAASDPAYTATAFTRPPASMLQSTAALVVGVNDPKPGDAPVAVPQQDSSPAAPAQQESAPAQEQSTTPAPAPSENPTLEPSPAVPTPSVTTSPTPAGKEQNNNGTTPAKQ
ncbi:penicillin-binding transpeptidase domain-containing protein [Arthrobacter psychrolactophilus]